MVELADAPPAAGAVRATPQIVVGVDGSPKSSHARWAAFEYAQAPKSLREAGSTPGSSDVLSLPELQLALDRALVRLHQAEAHAAHVLQEAQRSIADFEVRLLARKARLRMLGYPLS